jgi:hypothetical protein
MHSGNPCLSVHMFSRRISFKSLRTVNTLAMFVLEGYKYTIVAVAWGKGKSDNQRVTGDSSGVLRFIFNHR